MDIIASNRTEISDGTTIQRQIRGSGLLVAGRLLSAAVNFLCQVLIVRYLAMNDYGAWAYALSVVAFCQLLSNVGFQQVITRFVPAYHQRADYSRMLGTIALSCCVIVAVCTAILSVFFAAPQKILSLVHSEVHSLKVVFILIFLVPVEALDGVSMGLFASLANPGSIFIRRNVIAPGLKLVVVLLLITFHRDVLFLAYGYLAGSVLGLLLFGLVMVQHLRAQGFLEKLGKRQICVPFREVVAFALPMMTSDLLVMLYQSVAVLLLGYYHGIRDVALYQVVVPVAELNATIEITSGLLVMPAAARLITAGNREELKKLYWHTATWLAVSSFPIFVVTFAFSQPLTIMLFGPRYAEAAPMLAIRSLGCYLGVAFGFSGVTLKALEKVRYIVICNVGACVANLTMNLLLIPRMGALGAAIGTAATVAVFTCLKQVFLHRVVGINVLEAKYVSFYTSLGLGCVSLIFIRQLALLNLPLAIGLAAGVLTLIVVATREELCVRQFFPEATRIPLVRRFI